VSVKTRVRATSETVVGDSEIFSYVSRFHCMCCVEEVSNLVNRPVVFCHPNDGTSTQVVTQRVHLELPATTSRESLFSDDRNLDAHGHDKESLSKTNRPGFISTVRPDLSQPTHRLKEEDTLVVYYESRKRELKIRLGTSLPCCL
jgi:hypothetical protein